MNETNKQLMQQLYAALDAHDHELMAACYNLDAHFRDIAFDLHGPKLIHAMWHMICETDIRATFNVITAENDHGRVSLTDDYTFNSTGRPVHNVIDSYFVFRDGLILQHQDTCDPRAWAAMALGGVGGFLAGRVRFLRSYKAEQLLRRFIKDHPRYA
jgi:hypothetical protein